MESEESHFYQAFFNGVQAAGLELRDHWHPDSETAVIYKLRDPRSGKVMRYRIEYRDVTDAEGGAREADKAAQRFFGATRS